MHFCINDKTKRTKENYIRVIIITTYKLHIFVGNMSIYCNEYVVHTRAKRDF